MNEGVSVVVTACDFAGFIETALRSALAQGGVAEVIVVDAASGDGTPDILRDLAAREPRIRLVEVARHGPALSRNAGLKLARGALVAILDGDDAWPAGRLARQAALLRADPALDAAVGLVAYTDAIDPATLAPPPGARVEVARQHHLGAALFRRAALEAVGGFDQRFRYADDLDLLLRLRDAGRRIGTEEEVALYHRRYPGSLLTRPDPARAREFALAAGLSLQRRRAAGLPPAPPLLAAGGPG